MRLNDERARRTGSVVHVYYETKIYLANQITEKSQRISKKQQKLIRGENIEVAGQIFNRSGGGQFGAKIRRAWQTFWLLSYFYGPKSSPVKEAASASRKNIIVAARQKYLEDR